VSTGTAATVASSPRPALSVDGLSGPVGMTLLRDVSFVVPAGQTHVILGGIHAGKTMLLRHLVGLERADAGIIRIDGEEYDARGEPVQRVRRMRSRLGAVFEGSALFSRLSIVENVELPLLEHTPDGELDPDAIRDTARGLLAEVGLMAVDDETLPEQLGRAAQRRVALARALALRPPVLLLDEPTAGLDAHSAAELDELLVRLQERHGFGALVLSHEVRHAYGAARHIYVLADGRVVAEGTREALLASPHPAAQRLLQRRGRRP
jgi:phospholipid/cholesterol/gamma-HCH transport system ATP-binding protein